jgi:hypothetical protein
MKTKKNTNVSSVEICTPIKETSADIKKTHKNDNGGTLIAEE